MRAFTKHTGVALPLLRDNVDTDAIIPSREMKRVSRRGLAEGLFAGWRYSDGARKPDPDFILNAQGYSGASILLSGRNFGCGSSREHAVWALAEFGFRVVIAQSFATIFRNNCVRNGLLPLTLDGDAVNAIAGWVEQDPQAHLVTVDLERGQVQAPEAIPFRIDPAHRDMLLRGLDPIDVTLLERDAIDRWTAEDRMIRPWAYR